MGDEYPCDKVVPVEQEPRHHLVIANEFVRALAVEIAPHDRTLCHHHAHDYLLYVAGDAEIVSAARDEGPKTLSYRDGECELLTAGLVHVVENLGDAAFRNIVIEFLPPAAELRRAGEPRAKGSVEGCLDTGGTIARIRQVFDDSGTASVYAISLQGDAEAEVLGPAIVASPYEDEMELEEFGRATIELKRFSDLAWLPPRRNAMLRNRGNGSARMVVFQLGCSDGHGFSSIEASRTKKPAPCETG